MSILVNKHTKILVQGITGVQASFHVQRALAMGTNIVSGVSPQRGGTKYFGVPVFNTVKEAITATKAEASVLFVPAMAVKSAVQEAVESGLKLAVTIAAGDPVRDMLEIKAMLKGSATTLIGPNTPGIITPKEACLGIFPENIHQPGNIGLVSRSSTLTYEATLEIDKAGFGQSTVIGLGDDMIIGTDFVDILKRFHEDDKTKTIVLIGKLGGMYEEIGAEFYAGLLHKKPVIAYIAGTTMPFDYKMGYAGDIITHGKITAERKRQAMRQAGMTVVENLSQISECLKTLK